MSGRKLAFVQLKELAGRAVGPYLLDAGQRGVLADKADCLHVVVETDDDLAVLALLY